MPDEPLSLSPPSPGQLSCGHCDAAPEVQWQRRPTGAEFALLLDAEQAKRAQILRDADTQLPPPQFGPLPTVDTTTVAVFGCRDHAVHVEAAAQVHGADCSAPHPDHLPGCDCAPEPHPEPEPLSVPKAPTPSGWMLPISS